MTKTFRKHSRRILLISLVVLTWQFSFPQHAMAQVVAGQADPTSSPVVILPVGATVSPAIPLAVDVPTPPVTPPTEKVAKVRTVVMTAYSSTKDQTDGDPFTTASGAKVKDGVIAMNGVPFGTKVRMPEKFGTKVFVVQDRMSAKYGSSRGDIWMPTRHAAVQWGVRHVKVEILQ